MNQPLISILIPYKNAQDTLQRAIDSCLAQSYENLEILLCDDASDDDSLKIAQAAAARDGRIRLLKNEGAGVAAGQNTLLAAARGDYVTFLDSDDALTDGAISLLLQAAQEHRADCVSGGYYLCTGGVPIRERPVVTPGFVSSVHEDIHAYQLRQAKNRSFIWGRLYRRELFDGLRFPQNLCYEDIYMTPRLLDRVNTFVSLPKPVYYYILRAGSITFSARLANHMEGLQAREACDEFYREHYPALLGDSLDLSLEYGFFLLGRISRAGRRTHEREWNEAVDFLRRKRIHAKKAGVLLRGALMVFSLSPRLAGRAFALYSKIKNRV